MIEVFYFTRQSALTIIVWTDKIGKSRRSCGEIWKISKILPTNIGSPLWVQLPQFRHIYHLTTSTNSGSDFAKYLEPNLKNL